MTAFSALTRLEGGATWVVLGGELDVASLASLDAATGGPVSLVDLSALEFCDLAGQRVLLRLCALGAMLVGAQPIVERLFELTGQDRHLVASMSRVEGLPMGAVRAPMPA